MSIDIFETDIIECGREFNEILAEVHSGNVELTNYIDPNVKPLPDQQKAPDHNQRGFRLYQITELLNQCNAAAEIDAEENEGIISDDLAAQLDALEMAKETKVLSICKLMKNLENRIDGFKKATEAINKRMKSAKNDYDRLYNYLSLHLAEDEKYQDSEIELTWKKNTETIIEDLELIPDQYLKFGIEIPYSEDYSDRIQDFKEIVKRDPLLKLEKTPMKADRINPDLKKGVEIPGVKKATGKSIVIK